MKTQVKIEEAKEEYQRRVEREEKAPPQARKGREENGETRKGVD